MNCGLKIQNSQGSELWVCYDMIEKYIGVPDFMMLTLPLVCSFPGFQFSSEISSVDIRRNFSYGQLPVQEECGDRDVIGKKDLFP